MQNTEELTMKNDLQDVNIQHFRQALLSWNRKKNDREMPWKGEKDPYKIWLSEIILQQTRVEQGVKYYNNYILKYNTINDLANAHDDDVFKDWEGLGYYNRCRNMLFTARFIRDEYNGRFPEEYDKILALKGVGTYTAAAIASFAYNLPYAVVDGNVVRVLSRYLALNRQLVTSQDKKLYQEIATTFLSKRKPGEYNQAIMDFGATVCIPRNPKCDQCPIRSKCKAFKANAIDKYPPKKKKIKLKDRYFHYILLSTERAVYMRQRGSGDIWQSLYEPILVEQRKKPLWLKQEKAVYQTKQKLSHQQLHIHFYILNNIAEGLIDTDSYQKIPEHKLKEKAFPKSVYEFLKEFEYI